MTFISIILEQRKVADLFERGRGGRETDRKTECETERDIERDRERQRDRQRQRKRQRERDRERKRGRQRDREGGRDGETEKETERNRISHWMCSVKNGIPKIFAKFTEKYLRCSLTLIRL